MNDHDARSPRLQYRYPQNKAKRTVPALPSQRLRQPPAGNQRHCADIVS